MIVRAFINCRSESMKIKFAILPLLFLCLVILSVEAQWNALNSGYAITTNYHGKNVLPGTLITATAGTIDSNVLNVTFVWKFPNETIAFIDAEIVVGGNGTEWTDSSGSFPIYYAQSSYRPTIVGDWGVQAFFNGPGGHIHGQGTDIIAIRATSFNVIPEIPVIGTAGAAIAMLLGLGLFTTRRKKQS